MTLSIVACGRQNTSNEVDQSEPIQNNTDNNNIEGNNRENNGASSGSGQSTSRKSTTTVEGVYIGQIDNNSIEVRIDGEPDAYRLTDQSRDRVTSLENGDKIQFDYYKNQHGQKVIVSFQKEKQFIEGEFYKKIGPYTVGIVIDKKPVLFKLNDAAKTQLKNFKEGDKVRIEYSKDKLDQWIANEIIRIEN